MALNLPLKYKQDFDPESGRKAKICAYVTMQTHGGVDKLVTVTEEIRKFTGTTVEELCFTIDCFKTAAQDLEIEDENLTEEFQKLLSPSPRKKWNRMMEDQNDDGTPIGDTEAEFDRALQLFINLYARDKNSKQMMMQAIIKGTGGFHFKDDEEGADVRKHADRLETQMDNTNKLQGSPNELSDDDRKDLLFKSFKTEWQDLCHKDRGENHLDLSWDEIVGYMVIMLNGQIKEKKRKRSNDNGDGGRSTC